MKHTIVRYTLAIIGLFSVISCTDYLDNAPDDILTLDMVFNSKNRTEEWLAGIYDGIPDPYTPMMRNYDAYADDFSPSQDWRAFSDWDCIDKILGNWTPQSEWKGNFWSDFPVRIREAYIFLDNVKALPEQEVYQADVDNMKAEARFLIAYYYYLLVNTYGAIPFQTSLVDMNAPIDEILIGQTPYDKVIDWLDKEFKAVSELLPPSYTEERKYGRATSVMALAIRARMLLFAASPLVNGNDDPDYAAYTNNKGEAIFNSTYDPKKWERAVNACKDLLTEAEGNGYALYKEYNGDGSIDPFMSYSNMCYKEFNQGNKEILFARPDVSYDLYSQHSVPRGSRGQGGLGVTQELVDAFFMSNGLPAITGYEPNGEPIINRASGYNESGFSTQPDVRKTKWIEGDKDAKESNAENTVAPAGTFNMYVNREPRFYVSVLYNGAWYRQSSRYVDFYYEGEDGRPASGSLWDAPQTGYLLRKRVHPETNILNYSIPYRPGIICRLAEAYLNYAEA
ncbi:MAG: RagB/SusD family nutrient uptake outer membrane protein, partial [Barnesiella intestinihominis]